MSSLHYRMHVSDCLARSSPVRTVNKGTAGVHVTKQNASWGLCGVYKRDQCGVYKRDQCLWPSQSNSISVAALGLSANSTARERRSPEDSDEGHHHSLSKEEVERRVRKAANLMRAGDELAPFDKRTFNPALLLW